MGREDAFERSLIKTIDMQLKQVFGDTGTSVIYNYLQSAFSLRQDDIPKKLEIFSEGLDKFLSSGARVVEKIVLDRLYSDFGKQFQAKEGYRFVDYINELKKAMKENK